MNRNRNLLLLIILVASVLRLHELTGFSLSNDELSAMSRLQFDDVATVIREGVYPDFHPAGVQLFMYYWTLLFGFSEFMVRLPFALMGIASVFLIYRVGRLWFGEGTGLLSAATLAVLQYAILYSQIARPYSPGLMFSLLAAFFWSKIFIPEREKASLVTYAGFALSVSACMYIHYFSFIFAGILCAAGLFFISKNKLFPYLLCGVAIVVLYIPHLGIFFHQLGKGGVGGAEGWLGPPPDNALVKYLEFAFNDSQQLRLLVFIILIGTFFLYRKAISLSRMHLLSLLLFALPFSIAYYYSIYRNPVFQFSVLLFSFPFLLLLIYSFIPRGETGLTIKFLTVAILLGGIYSTVKEKKYYQSNHFTEFRGIARNADRIISEYGDNNVTRAISVFSPYYIDYYMKKLPGKYSFDMYSVMTPTEVHDFSMLIDTSKSPYFLHAFSNVYDDPRFDMMIRSKYPSLIYRDSLLNSGLRLYTRDTNVMALNRAPALVYKYGFEKGEWNNESEMRDSLIKKEGSYSIYLREQNEFGPTYEKKVSETGIKPGAKIELSAAFYADISVKSAKFVVSIEKDGQSKMYESTVIDQAGNYPHQWVRQYLAATAPVNLEGDEVIKIYIWNEKKERIRMDDLILYIYSPAE